MMRLPSTLFSLSHSRVPSGHILQDAPRRRSLWISRPQRAHCRRSRVNCGPPWALDSVREEPYTFEPISESRGCLDVPPPDPGFTRRLVAMDSRLDLLGLRRFPPLRQVEPGPQHPRGSLAV